MVAFDKTDARRASAVAKGGNTNGKQFPYLFKLPLAAASIANIWQKQSAAKDGYVRRCEWTGLFKESQLFVDATIEEFGVDLSGFGESFNFGGEILSRIESANATDQFSARVRGKIVDGQAAPDLKGSLMRSADVLPLLTALTKKKEQIFFYAYSAWDKKTFSFPARKDGSEIVLNYTVDVECGERRRMTDAEYAADEAGQRIEHDAAEKAKAEAEALKKQVEEAAAASANTDAPVAF